MAAISNRITIALGLGILVLAAPLKFARGEAPVQLADINTTDAFSDGGGTMLGAQSGTKFFFTRSSIEAGNELWVTDGTAGGTVFVKDIDPGTRSSNPRGFVPSFIGGKNVVFFSAETTAEGRELWISDGTAAGTNLVEDIYPGAESSNPLWITGPANGPIVVFAATDPTNGRELWISDGTSGNTDIGVDVNPGDAGSDPSDIYFDGSNIVWAADDGVHGREPWFDTTSTNPAIAGDLNTGPDGSNPAEFTLAGGGTKLYFSATTPSAGTELWMLDASSPNFTPSFVKDLVAGADSSSPSDFITRSGNSIYFFTRERDSSFLFPKLTLWRSDGTEVGTTVVKDFGDILPVPPVVHDEFSFFRSSGYSISPIIASNGKLYFFAGLTNGRQGSDGFINAELWMSDGTEAGTVQIADVFPGVGGNFSSTIAPLNNGVVTLMSDGTHGVELWTSMGTAESTSLLADLNPGVAGFAPGVDGFPDFTVGDLVKGQSGALAVGAIGDRRKIVFTDGTSENTRVIGDAADSSKTASSGAYFQTAIGTKGIFSASDGTLGGELYVSDGSAPGTSLLKDIEPLGASNPFSFQTFADGSKAIFSAFTFAAGAELWITDGTAAGTSMVRDLNPGAFSSNPRPLGVELNGKIFFTATDGISGVELWATDGTSAGTVRIKDVAADAADSNITSAVLAGNQIFFAASTVTAGNEIWVSDGTEAGTKLVVDLSPGTSGSSPSGLAALGNAVVFAAATTGSGRELWKSDGTAAGTAELKDINPGPSGSNPTGMFVANNLVYFAADDSSIGRELWVTDGTADGTKLLKDINTADGEGSEPESFAALGSQVVFRAVDEDNGYELWTTSGTTESTTLLKDINPAALSGFPDQFVAVPGSNLLFFSAMTPSQGTELWQTDGTAGGTVLVSDINPGAPHSFPTNLIAAADKLFFSADNGSTGQEPFALTVDICPSDAAKTAPGVCGCGVVEDANSNTVPDCLAATDLKAQLTALSKALGKLKPAKNAKQLKLLKANKKAAAALLKSVTNIVKTKKSVIKVKGKISLSKGAGKVKADTSVALKLQGSLIADVKKAKAGIAALSKSLVL